MKRLASLPRRPLRIWFNKQSRSQRRLAKVNVEWLMERDRLARDGKLAEGRDGWLFIAEDTNDVFGQQTGTCRFAPGDLERWGALMEERSARFASRGCPYAMLIAPDTHSLYPEKLPPGTPLVAERPVHQLLNAIERAAPDIPVLYPLARMKAEKQRRKVCSPVDSHWTDYGAFVAYEALVEELANAVALRRLTRAELGFADMVGGGDLGVKLLPLRFDVHPIALMRYQQARLVYDNCIDNVGSVAVTECRGAPDTTCLVLGDSYSYSLMRFVAESFGRVVVQHSAYVDWELVDDIQPDVVVSVMAERFLMEVPEDGVDHAANEAKKRAAGRGRPPLSYWFGRRWPSPLDVEQLRAHFLAAGNQRDAVLVSVLAYAGLVAPEVTTLRWPDVGEREIAVREPSSRVGEAPSRRVPLLEPLARDLRDWRRRGSTAKPNALVFPGVRDPDWSDGEWSWWRSEVFEPAVRECRLDVESPLHLRDTYCTLLIHQRLPAREIARRIGETPREVRHLYPLPLEVARKLGPTDPELLIEIARRTIADRTPASSLRA